VAKKRTASRKPVRAKKAGSSTRSKSTGGDSSRLDTGPLQEHIRKRIKDLEGKAAARAGGDRMQADDTLERLKVALETLEDICEPTMTIPI
jgi:hypothetical protein